MEQGVTWRDGLATGIIITSMESARTKLSSSNTFAVSKWLERGMEPLWLLAVFLVPLVFLDRDYAKSEAVIGYVEVPKIALLRLLAGLMAVLWLVEWGIHGRVPLGGFSGVKTLALRPITWISRLAIYLQGRPHRWVILAVSFYLATTLLSTILSGSFSVSLWGEIPGQDGYSAYTITAYVLVFAVIATHLKTRSQLWRLLAAITAMGTLVGGYAVLQNYGHDFLNLSEITGGHTTAFMGNTIFAAAVLMMTIPISLAAAVVSLVSLPDTGIPRLSNARQWPLPLTTLGVWVAVLAVQLLGLIFTSARGPWLATIFTVAVMLGLVAVFSGRKVLARLVLVLGLALAVTAAVLLDPTFARSGEEESSGPTSVTAGIAERSEVTDESRNTSEATESIAAAAGPGGIQGVGGETSTAGKSFTVAVDPAAAKVAGRIGSISGEVLGGFTGGRGTHWKVSWRLIQSHPWFGFDNLSLRWLRPLVGYGPDLFRYTYLLESIPEGPELYPLEPDHAHNFFIHQTVEQGFVGLLSFLGIFAAVFLAGGYQLLRTRQGLSPVHLLMLSSLLAVVLGRSLEMMVGIARVSDLTVFWILLGMFAALPAVMQTSEERSVSPTRRRRQGERDRSPAPRSTEDRDPNWYWIWRLAVVAWLAGGIVLLTWFQGLNYPRAAIKAAEAVTHWQQTDLPSTLADLNRAIALAPGVPVYHSWRASVYLAYGFDRSGPREKECSQQTEHPYKTCLALLAHQSYRQGSERSPYYYRSRLFLANSAASLSLRDEAAQYYGEAVGLVPRSWQLRNKLAEAYITQGQPGIALGPLQESLAITKHREKSAQAFFLQGQAYQALKESEKAADSFERSLELRPSGPLAENAHIQLAVFYAGQRDKDQALEHLSLNIGINDQNPNAYVARGKAHFLFEQYDRSLEDYEQAIRRDPSNDEAGKLGKNLATVFVSRGESLSNLGQYWSAIGEYDRALRAYSQFPPAYRERGIAWQKLGLLGVAMRDLKNVVRLAPEDEKAQAYLDETVRKISELQQTILDTDQPFR